MGDYIGMFANTAGLGLERLTAKYKAALDDYSFIMAEALADRLAEAVAEKVHEDVRRCDRFAMRICYFPTTPITAPHAPQSTRHAARGHHSVVQAPRSCIAQALQQAAVIR